MFTSAASRRLMSSAAVARAGMQDFAGDHKLGRFKTQCTQCVDADLTAADVNGGDGRRSALGFETLVVRKVVDVLSNIAGSTRPLTTSQ